MVQAVDPAHLQWAEEDEEGMSVRPSVWCMCTCLVGGLLSLDIDDVHSLLL